MKYIDVTKIGSNQKSNEREKVKIIDCIPGSGKTSFAIDFMKEHEKEYSFIYITPFLKEIDRVKKEIPSFSSPKNKGNGKLEDFKKLIMEQKNIASTHVLFSFSDTDVVELLNVNRYVLVLDEAMTVLEEVPIKKWDVETLLTSGAISYDKETCVVRYNEDATPDSAFSHIINLIKTGKVIMSDEMRLLFWVFPLDVFECFEKVFVLTYMFDGQIMKYYFDYYNVGYDMYSVKGKYPTFEMVEFNNIRPNLNIDILEDLKLNKIGKTHTALSKNWYKNASNSLIKQLGKNMNNYFINIMEVKTIKDFFWTTYIDYIDHMPKRFKGSFVPCTMRATNDYKDRHYMCYLVNRYINPNIIKFFSSRDIKVNQDMFALSELIQWVFRSGVRAGEDVHIYIPSKRMRDLLKGYLNDTIHG